ncbi:MAG: beta-ketoacyl-ACP synthase II [Chloroflexota bacterium]|nr:beta-ketoacyl-ACP synthase II [Chloroflexota bacterium]
MEPVVITGLGAITPIGLTVEEFWKNLRDGVSGVGPITQFDTEGFAVRIAAEVKGFEPRNYMDFKLARRTARSAQFAIAAAKMALEDADSVTNSDPTQWGVVMNTGGAAIADLAQAGQTLAEEGPRHISPFLVPSIMPNAISCLVSIATGAKGPIVTSTAACASGNYALLEAMHILRRGDAQAVIAGGAESVIAPLAFAGLGRVGALSKYNDRPTEACRPFDRDRQGFVFGEGAAAFVVETLSHARQRGAKIYAEIAGGALTGDAYHVTAPHPEGEGAARAMRLALEDAELQPQDIDHISAHGTGTVLNDVTETKAIKAVFGEHAYRLAISATKSMVGHLLGAASAVAALAACLTLRDGIIPPTINLDNPDPECDLDYVPNVARRQPVRVAMVNGFGFGGQNAVVILRQPPEI